MIVWIKKLYVLIIILFISGFYGCSNSENNPSATSNPIPETDATASTAIDNKAGQNLYLKYCMACHQTDGSGVPGMYPPLINSPTVNSGNKEDIIKILLNGLKGPIEVHGQKYNQQMPKQDFLSDEDLALIINFISTSFNNKGEEVTPGEIKALRNTSSK